MTDNNRPVVLSAKRFRNLHVLDGGDTIAISLSAPDGREVVVLLPQEAVADLGSRISDALHTASEQRAARSIRD